MDGLVGGSGVFTLLVLLGLCEASLVVKNLGKMMVKKTGEVDDWKMQVSIPKEQSAGGSLRARYLDLSFLCFYSEPGLLKVVSKTAVSMAWF